MAFNFEKLQSLLQTTLTDEKLFSTSFTHRSYLNEHHEYKGESNERLEFLGDAVLQLLSSEYLFKCYPKQPEGVLTNYRSAIVCTPSLGEEAKRLGYGDLLFLSHGEEATGGREREYILANTFEAVLGALYLHKGIDYCREFVTRELFHKVNDVVENEEYKDAKSKFQELSQEKLNVTPNYNVIESWGPDHEKMFKVGVYLDSKLYGVGEGRSKQKAEQKAAIEGLKTLSE